MMAFDVGALHGPVGEYASAVQQRRFTPTAMFAQPTPAFRSSVHIAIVSTSHATGEHEPEAPSHGRFHEQFIARQQ